MRKLLVPIVTISALLLAFISTPAQAATYDGTSGTVDCTTSGSFTITDNVVTSGGCAGNALIPDSVTSIGDFAFAYETELLTVTFGVGSQLDSIANFAFYQATALTSIAIPDSAKTIGEFAFLQASGLTTVTFGVGSQLDSIGDNAFNGTSLTSIAIPDSVRFIRSSAFREAVSLATVTFGLDSQLVLIDNNAFNGATSLTSIRIPESVTSIGGEAFVGASALEGFYFFGEAPSIGDASFDDTGAMAYIKSGAANFPAVGSKWNNLTIAVGVYSLDYDSNDGSAVSSRLFVTGDSVSAPTQPTKSGNTFAGWSATNGGSAVTFPYSLSQTADVVLYALWTAIPVSSSPAPATNSDEEALESEKEIAARTISAKAKYSVKSLAKRVGVSIVSPKAKLSLKVAKASKKICRVSGKRLITRKAGTCKVTFIVQEPKPKKGKKPKATRTVEVLIVNKKVTLA